MAARQHSRSRAGSPGSYEPADTPAPVLFTTDDEISEGSATTRSPFGRVAKRLQRYSTVKQPNHLQTVIAEVDVDGEPHLVKFSRYWDNPQFWTSLGERDERLRGRQTVTVTEPEADDQTRALQNTMLGLLAEQLAAKRLTPSAGELPGYRPPEVAATAP